MLAVRPSPITFLSHINVKAIMAENIIGHGNPAPGQAKVTGQGTILPKRSLTGCNGGGGNTWVSGLTTTQNRAAGVPQPIPPFPLIITLDLYFRILSRFLHQQKNFRYKHVEC